MPALAEPARARELAGVGDVRIWSVDLALPAPVVAALAAVLTPAERDRAASMASDPARRRFVVARASLRRWLAEATGVSPDRVEIGTGRDGKPFLVPVTGGPVPEFNLSHSRDLALIALGGCEPLGIDVEWTAGSSPIEAVVGRFFSAAERARLEEAPAEERRELFFRIWVRKEAYLKGRGEGISEWIHRTDFSSVTGRPGRELDQDAWLVRDLVGLPPGFVASLAVARRAERARAGAASWRDARHR